MSDSRARRLVLVEDDSDIRELMETFLRDAGYLVEAIGDPAGALELVRRVRPDLVLCDIAMPGKDGHQVLRELREDPETAGYPVMFVTAQREFSERVEAFKFGVVDYLTKPFTREILLRKVERAIAGRGFRPGRVRVEADAAQLVDEVRRDERTGVLKVQGEAAPRQLIVRDGRVVEGAAPEGARTAEFEELDPRTEHVVGPDPVRMGGPVGGASFAELPAALRRVLIVDDNAEFRSFLQQLLVSHGFTVHEAADGEEALRLALEHRPWLILTDVAMPGVDGVELCRRVRRHSLIRHTPLVFLSGWDDYRERHRGMEAGGDEFVSKHTPLRELLIRLQLVMNRYVRLGGAQRASAMEGRLELVGAAGVLQMCHLGQLTGRLIAHSEAGDADITFRAGEIVAARAGQREREEALKEYLAWNEGRFRFEAGAVGHAPPLGENFSQLLLEACRQLDEGSREGEPL